MPENDNAHRHASTKTFVYSGNVPMWLGLLIAAPVLLFAFSLVAALLVGGGLAALVLPSVFRRSAGATRRDDSIELQASEYHRVEEPTRQLPDRKA